jgi:DNA-binding MarR family transcriptional regulator
MVHKNNNPTTIPQYPALVLTSSDRELFDLIRNTMDLFIKVRDRELRKEIIGYKRVYILPIIDRLGDRAIPVEIAKQLCRKRNTVTELLDKIETDGWIVKANDESNRKIIKIRLTEKGRETLQIFNARTSVRNVISVLSPDERFKLESSLTKLKDWLITSMRIPISKYVLEVEADIRVFGLIMDTAHLLENIIRNKLSDNDLEIDISRRNVLQNITYSGDHCTATDLARSLNKERCTLSKMLTKMEKEDLIKRMPNVINKKEIMITITCKGFEQYREWNKLETNCRLNSILNGDETEDMIACFTKLYDRLISVYRTVNRHG